MDSRFAGSEFDLYALILQAQQQGIDLQSLLEEGRRLKWGAESARLDELMRIRVIADKLAGAQAAAVPQPLGVAPLVFS